MRFSPCDICKFKTLFVTTLKTHICWRPECSYKAAAKKHQQLQDKKTATALATIKGCGHKYANTRSYACYISVLQMATIKKMYSTHTHTQYTCMCMQIPPFVLYLVNNSQKYQRAPCSHAFMPIWLVHCLQQLLPSLVRESKIRSKQMPLTLCFCLWKRPKKDIIGNT